MLQSVGQALADFFGGYWSAAVTPLHQLGWATFSLLAFITVFLALAATYLLRRSWRFSKPVLTTKKVRSNHHNYPGHLRLNVDDYKSFKNFGGAVDTDAWNSMRADEGKRHYVVTIVERTQKRVVLYRELIIDPGRKKGGINQQYVQFSQSDLAHIRLNNGHDDDDSPEADVSGDYDVYIRKVRWYDVRHWLLHPNREVRIAVWVSVLTTSIPAAIDLLFG